MTNGDGDGVFDQATVQSWLRPLAQALVASCGEARASEALSIALEYAWRHYDRVAQMDHPIAYLAKVGETRSRERSARVVVVPFDRDSNGPRQDPLESGSPFEPGLVPALQALSDRERTCVLLVEGAGWRPGDVADLLGISRESVNTYNRRGLQKLRNDIGVAQ